MIELSIPGRGEIRLEHLVLDVNGTLAVDGHLIEGVSKRIASLKDRFNIHLMTADTHGRQQHIDEMLGTHAIRIDRGNETAQKADYVKHLGSDTVIAIGQGANDAGMLTAARIGIAVNSPEGLCTMTLLAADLVMPGINEALDLLDKPLRLIATLRQ